MKPQQLSEVDRWSHSENYKWAHELNQVLGAEDPRAVKQWQETNKILTENKGMERVMQITINGKVVHPIYKKRKRKPKNTDLTPLGMLKRELKFMEMRAKYNNREGGKYGKKYAQEMVIEYKKAIETLTQNSSRHDREE